MQIVLLQPFLRYFYTDRGLSEHKTCQYSTTYNLDFHKLAKIQIDENPKILGKSINTLLVLRRYYTECFFKIL